MIVDQSALPIVVIEPDGTIQYASGFVSRVLGRPAEQLVGHNTAEFLVPEQLELALEVIDEIEQVDRGGAGVPMVFAVQRPAGDPIWVEIGAMPLLDVPGVNGIVLRLRPWDAQYHLDEFFAALLADAPLGARAVDPVDRRTARGRRRRGLLRRLQHLAAHDPLTGAANRSEFRDRLARALAIGERNFAVAFCDLDHFKPVNDTFGHQVGDQVLVQVVDRMRSTLRAGDELVRAGGDEFTVLVRNVPTLDAARDVAERLVAVMRAPFDADGHHVHLSISVGVALTDSVHSADELLDLADTALYAVKRAGGDAAALAAS